MRTCVVSGSFDPITCGHEDIIRRAALLYDRVVVGIAVNSGKQGFFPTAQRIRWAEAVAARFGNVCVRAFSGLRVELALKEKASAIVRGVRGGPDFEYEMGLASVNRRLAPDIETVLLPCQDENRAVSSTFARDLIVHGGSLAGIVPEYLIEDMMGAYKDAKGTT